MHYPIFEIRSQVHTMHSPENQKIINNNSDSMYYLVDEKQDNKPVSFYHFCLPSSIVHRNVDQHAFQYKLVPSERNNQFFYQYETHPALKMTVENKIIKMAAEINLFRSKKNNHIPSVSFAAIHSFDFGTP